MLSSTVRRSLLLGTILAATPAFAADMPDDSSVIVVTGEKSVNTASAGTKSSVPLVETPQSISVIDASEIAGLGLQNLNQALRFVAGVTPEQRGSSGEVYDQFKLRGFDALRYLDGLRVFDSPSGYAATQVDVSRLDRIEVVKGPASALYGQSGPGGLIGLSSKLPLDQDAYGAVAGSYGTYDLYRVDADVGGRISPMVLYRLYGSVNGADTQQRFGRRERQTVSGAVTLGPDGPTSFTLLAAYSHDPYNGTYSVFPASGTFIPNPNGTLSTRFDGGEAGNRFQREQAGITYILNHDFGGGWNFRSSGRYQYVGSKLGIVYTSGAVLNPAQTLFGRASYATDEKVNGFTYDNQLTGTFRTGPITHRLLFGLDRQVLRSTEDYAFGSGTPISAFDPVYGMMPVPRSPAEVPDPFGGAITSRLRQQGVYAQDEMALGGLRVTLSGRQDWARVRQIGSPAEHSDKFTYRAGALYKTGFGLAPYVSYATSFQPQSGQAVKGDGSIGIADPSSGRQIEGGAKYQVPGTQILVTAAYFRIRQSNVLTSRFPALPIQSGSVLSRGFEVEATAPLPYGFGAKLAYSRQNVTTRNPDAAAPVSNRILGVGRGNAAFNLEWAPQAGAAEGLALGGAVRYVDKVFAGTYVDGITRNTPSYTLFDALARYDLGKAFPRLAGFTLAVNAQNVFDNKHVSSCYLDYGWCFYGNRRTVQGTIGYRW